MAWEAVGQVCNLSNLEESSSRQVTNLSYGKRLKCYQFSILQWLIGRIAERHAQGDSRKRREIHLRPQVDFTHAAHIVTVCGAEEVPHLSYTPRSWPQEAILTGCGQLTKFRPSSSPLLALSRRFSSVEAAALPETSAARWTGGLPCCMEARGT